MRLAFSLRRKWRYRTGPVLSHVYLSINSGKTYWITGKQCRRRRVTKWHWWKNWTVHCDGRKIGTWSLLLEAKYQAQLHHDKE